VLFAHGSRMAPSDTRDALSLSSLASPSLYVRSCRRDERGIAHPRAVALITACTSVELTGQARPTCRALPWRCADCERVAATSTVSVRLEQVYGLSEAWAPWLQVDHGPRWPAQKDGYLPIRRCSTCSWHRAVPRALHTGSCCPDPGPCGAGLLAGSSWLGGGGVPIYSNGQDEGSGARCGGTN